MAGGILIFLFIIFVILGFWNFYIWRALGVIKVWQRVWDKIQQHNRNMIKKGRYDTHKISYSALDDVYTFKEMTLNFWIPLRIMERKLLRELDKVKVVGRLTR